MPPAALKDDGSSWVYQLLSCSSSRQFQAARARRAHCHFVPLPTRRHVSSRAPFLRRCHLQELLSIRRHSARFTKASLKDHFKQLPVPSPPETSRRARFIFIIVVSSTHTTISKVCQNVGKIHHLHWCAVPYPGVSPLLLPLLHFSTRPADRWLSEQLDMGLYLGRQFVSRLYSLPADAILLFAN